MTVWANWLAAAAVAVVAGGAALTGAAGIGDDGRAPAAGRKVSGA